MGYNQMLTLMHNCCQHALSCRCVWFYVPVSWKALPADENFLLVMELFTQSAIVM